ncbi:glycerophosphodiester phosphodiesterase [Spirilliplanes yamanashiensis]|uniref:Glycerophosphodiester phosphodiesterase n=1 Tax=Spirilliplanes yamanashiensis TaxID=42233 RepID=A0A8J3Y4I9_9ACTN|nr:glycerophosphodiester phosphodiesterase family protein [Spirilliplanes yamanashiensis]MDP9819570.1 glycerophosphoryl diester phosphodiesterase [Spirilliplanes yamanashiensis]GIJ01608.1 glycerophosphodiester phosphodiesterase [Spirilliplanes yamanashiensis]
MTFVVAHRGYAGIAPENTLLALHAGVAAGADWIEFDVRTTADGVPVVIHDRLLGRTVPGAGPVAEVRFDDLRSRDAGGWFAPVFAGVRVPTLAEVLDLLAAAPGPQVLLEIKPPATGDEVKAILAQLTERGLVRRTVLQSFADPVLHAAAELLPELRRGVLREGLDADPAAVVRAHGAVFYNPSLADVVGDPSVVPAVAAAGAAVMPWTVNEPAGWAAALGLGVGGIITDRPAELRGWLAARG